MKKKLFVFLIMLVITSFVLVACGGADTAAPEAPAETETEAEAPADRRTGSRRTGAEEPAAEEPAEEIGDRRDEDRLLRLRPVQRVPSGTDRRGHQVCQGKVWR